MDTCVMIPNELALVLTLQPNKNNVLQMHVAVWSNTTLAPGTQFRPNDGQVRIEKLENSSEISEDDIRRHYGSEDYVSTVEGRKLRHCNWVRFLRTSDVTNDINMVGFKIKDEVMFQVVKTVLPNEEIVAFLQTADDTNTLEQLLKQQTPNLTKVKIENDEKPVSPVPFPVIRDMMTSPPSREDDCKSSVSDVTHSEDEVSPAVNTTCTPETERYSDPDLSPYHTNAFPQQVSPLDLTSHKTPLKPYHSSPFTSPAKSNSRSLMTSPNSLSSPTSPPEAIMRPKRNRERTWLPCDVCGKKFDRPSLLKRHMRTHTGEKPHACDVCGKAFSTSSSLNTHRRIHSGEKPHQCGVCGKRFTASSNLYYHKMTHNKDKPHKCQLCSKSFPTPGDLRSHMYVHNGSWPYRCDVCNRGFSKQTNLKNHLLLHTGDKPHECPTCQKKFALYCNLKTHMKTHEDDTQGSCCTCGRTFLKKGEATSDRCADCMRTPSPKSPSTKRHLSDFSISKLTNSDSKTSATVPTHSIPTSSVKDEYDAKMLAFYNPFMFMSPQAPRSPYFGSQHIPIGYLPVYGGVGSPETYVPSPAGSLLQRYNPGMSLTDSYRLHSSMTSLKADWTSGLIAK